MEIEVYDFKGKETKIVPTYQAANFNAELEQFAQDNWETNHAGWTNSYVVSPRDFNFSQGNLAITADHMRYSQIAGMVKAIEESKLFAPQSIPGLSVGIYMVTSDNRLILPRRSKKLNHAPNFYNNFAGWMASMNIASRAECEDYSLTKDARLYDPLSQAIKEAEEESTLSYDSEFQISKKPLSIVAGFAHSFSYLLNFLAKTNHTAEMVKTKILRDQEEFAAGLKEHDKVAALNLDHLYDLLMNQPELHQEDPLTFEPTNDRELILIDDCVGSLVAHYEDLTGKQRPANLIKDLRKKGININLMTTVDKIYSFR